MPKTFQRAVAAGFTLIELLIVVIILAILVALAIPQFLMGAADADDARSRQFSPDSTKDDPDMKTHAPH